MSQSEPNGHLEQARQTAAVALDQRDPGSRPSSPKLNISPEALRIVPAEFAKRHRILPLEIHNGTINIATAEMGNQRVIDDLRLLTGLEVQEFEAPAADILEKMAECYQVTVEKMIESLNPEHAAAVEGRNLHDIEVMANEPTVINLVNLIISTALRERASDIHLVPFEQSIQLRYRIDGLLQEKPPPPKQLHAALVSRIKIMADMNIAERYMPQDGHIQINHRGARVDIRVGTLPTIYGEGVVLRLLEKNSRMLTTQELGLETERATLLSRLVEKPHGLFLATGPTGSGKTTTLYAILQGIYTPEKKILTIEDPVEYELPGVAQIPVRPSRNFTFATGLRSILRQDPDVVMVGEIRDSETAEIAIRAALTGHQVFSTLHTNDSTGAVTRLLDMGVEAFLISSSLEGVLAQRLVRRICQQCKTEWPVSAAVRARVEALGGRRVEGVFYQGNGCEECRGTGYRGRVGIFELLAITNEIKELILQKRSNAELKATAQKTMVTMHQDALQKAAAGITSLEEILRVSSGDLLE
ncbi:MAG TPA: GspE/PulE family protein [Candidatus Binatia bacterium]|jgi:type IV pilus assembly protein PilB|nr:GspE/PulE family protein [Candidatus Binatia bacterium]